MTIPILPLVVLAVGLVAGIIVASRISRRKDAPAESELQDLELRIGDLERQRDEIYDRLRGSESVDLTEGDREVLELSAARTLRQLEELTKLRRQRMGVKPKTAKKPRKKPVAAKTKEGASEAAAEEDRRSFAARHPGVMGALVGAASVVVLVLLIVWAQGDAQPGERTPPPPERVEARPADAPSGAETEAPPLPPFVASRVQELESGLTGGPSDLASYREMAELYLASERFTEAFDAAAKALEIDRSDAPSLYVQGVVRYMMGQPGEAIDLLDRSLASDPSNTQAASLKGLFLIQMEDRVGAVETWETALEAAGGTDAQLEHLIGLAREGRSAEEILNSPPPTSSD